MRICKKCHRCSLTWPEARDHSLICNKENYLSSTIPTKFIDYLPKHNTGLYALDRKGAGKGRHGVKLE